MWLKVTFKCQNIRYRHLGLKISNIWQTARRSIWVPWHTNCQRIRTGTLWGVLFNQPIPAVRIPSCFLPPPSLPCELRFLSMCARFKHHSLFSFAFFYAGMRLGGLYVFGPGDQGLVFAHREETVGKEADVDQVGFDVVYFFELFLFRWEQFFACFLLLLPDGDVRSSKTVLTQERYWSGDPPCRMALCFLFEKKRLAKRPTPIRWAPMLCVLLSCFFFLGALFSHVSCFSYPWRCTSLESSADAREVVVRRPALEDGFAFSF